MSASVHRAKLRRHLLIGSRNGGDYSVGGAMILLARRALPRRSMVWRQALTRPGCGVDTLTSASATVPQRLTEAAQHLSAGWRLLGSVASVVTSLGHAFRAHRSFPCLGLKT